jgi:phage FluMu protein gp41
MNRNIPKAPMIDLNAQPTGKLRHGLKIGDSMQTDYEFQTEITAGDYFAAEDDAGGRTSLRFDAALVARQLKRIGTFDGPFNASLLGKLKPNDMAHLIRVREALEAKGNAEPSGDPSS